MVTNTPVSGSMTLFMDKDITFSPMGNDMMENLGMDSRQESELIIMSTVIGMKGNG